MKENVRLKWWNFETTLRRVLRTFPGPKDRKMETIKTWETLRMGCCNYRGKDGKTMDLGARRDSLASEKSSYN